MKTPNTFRALWQFSYALVALFFLVSCSQDESEPIPAEQVIGSYTGISYSEGTNGVSQNYDLTNATIQASFSVAFEVAKKSDNVVTVTMIIIQKDENGQSQTYRSVYENVELKKLNGSNDLYEMFYDGLRLGEIGNGTLKLEETYDDTDANGRNIKIDVKIGAKKK